MAFYTDTIDFTARPAFSNAIRGFFTRIIAAQNRSIDVERMQDLSDAELAQMGLTRDGIVRHVYRDIYYV
ncbi:hypothetical protein BC777_0325 [Yoonia maricola]|uniref:DUF1127 domain-containing protein n=1 Tax=Yoonia maricola TaxID=420999 RepID=A0A2M8WKQ6_9RHOB|nr:DUF1127 domain-containing protein [Yoonia maricola]PJI91497.1 hypothetical protein BC777_0325 [Yoonia maricola]